MKKTIAMTIAAGSFYYYFTQVRFAGLASYTLGGGLPPADLSDTR